jgi:hypothetical protein
LNSKTKTVDSGNSEFTDVRFGINFKPTSGKTSNSLSDQIYTKENEILFIGLMLAIENRIKLATGSLQLGSGRCCF